MGKTKFRSPRRRLTRQRSGFKVGEGTTGGECKIKVAKALDISEENVTLVFEKNDLNVPELFERNKGIIAFGGYINIAQPVDLELEMICTIQGRSVSKVRKQKIDPTRWYAIGIHVEDNLDPAVEAKTNVKVKLSLKSKTKIGSINFFGIEMNSLDREDYVTNLKYQGNEDIYNRFNQKTSICVPYLYYFKHNKPFTVFPINIDKQNFKDGKIVVLKSCNRCGRFLLVEYEQEKQRNLISFGNHCVKTAPCDHGAFGRQKILENEADEKNIRLPSELTSIIEENGGNKIVHMHYGYQLECKACKKFYVNAALNPMRNSTQHREDSLRRRAIEVLVDQLLKKKWIYHKFRLKEKKEFDKHIWEKFGKKCFKCGKDLESPNKMDLDHTLPLSALWPLEETATCLCPKCNSEKSDKFPIEFYTKDELKQLSKITGMNYKLISHKNINEKAFNGLIKNIEWFFDEFLNDKDYQKIRGDKKTADLILKAIQKQLNKAGKNIDLIEEYHKKTDRLPSTITLDS